MKFKFNSEELLDICSDNEKFTRAMKNSMGLVLKSMDDLGVLPPKDFLLKDLDVLTLPFLFKNYSLDDSELSSIQKIYTLNRLQKNSESVNSIDDFNIQEENINATKISKEETIEDASLALSSLANYKVVTDVNEMIELFKKREGFLYNDSHTIDTLDILVQDGTLTKSINLYGSYRNHDSEQAEQYLYDFVNPWLLSVLKKADLSDLRKMSPQLINIIKEIGLDTDEIPLLNEFSKTYEYKKKELLSSVSNVPPLYNISGASLSPFISNEEELLAVLKKSFNETKSEKKLSSQTKPLIININDFSKKAHDVLETYERDHPGFYNKLNNLFENTFVNGWDNETLSKNKKIVQEEVLSFNSSGYLSIDRRLISSLPLTSQAQVFDVEFSMDFFKRMSKEFFRNLNSTDFREIAYNKDAAVNFLEFSLLNIRNLLESKNQDIAPYLGEALYQMLNVTDNSGIYDNERNTILQGLEHIMEKYPDDVFRPEFDNFWEKMSLRFSDYAFRNFQTAVSKNINENTTVNKQIILLQYLSENKPIENKSFKDLSIDEKLIIKDLFKLNKSIERDEINEENLKKSRKHLNNSKNNIFLDMGENSKTLKDVNLIGYILNTENGLNDIKKSIVNNPLDNEVIKDILNSLYFNNSPEMKNQLLDLLSYSFKSENSLFDLKNENNIVMVNKVPELRNFITKKEFTYREFKEINITYDLNKDNKELREEIVKRWNVVPSDEKEKVFNQYVANKDWNNFKVVLDSHYIKAKVFSLDNEDFLEAGIKDCTDFGWLRSMNNRDYKGYTEKQLDFLLGRHLELLKTKGVTEYTLGNVVKGLDSYSETVKDLVIDKYPVLLLTAKSFVNLARLSPSKFNSYIRRGIKQIDKDNLPRASESSLAKSIGSPLFLNLLKEKLSFKEKMIMSYILVNGANDFKETVIDSGKLLIAGGDITQEDFDKYYSLNKNPDTGTYYNKCYFPELQKVEYLKENISDYKDMLSRGLDTSPAVYAYLSFYSGKNNLDYSVISSAFDFLNTYKTSYRIEKILSEDNQNKEEMLMETIFKSKYVGGEHKIKEIVPLNDNNFELMSSILTSNLSFFRNSTTSVSSDERELFLKSFKDLYIQGLLSSELSIENKEIIINLVESSNLREETGFKSQNINNYVASEIFSSPDIVNVVNSLKLSSKIESTLDSLNTSFLEESDGFDFCPKI